MTQDLQRPNSGLLRTRRLLSPSNSANCGWSLRPSTRQKPLASFHTCVRSLLKMYRPEDTLSSAHVVWRDDRSATPRAPAAGSCWRPRPSPPLRARAGPVQRPALPSLLRWCRHLRHRPAPARLASRPGTGPAEMRERHTAHAICRHTACRSAGQLVRST